MKILIGYDGSVHADGALYDLARAGLPEKCEALVFSVTTPWLPFGPAGEPSAEGWEPAALAEAKAFSELALKEAQTQAERGARYLKRHFPDWKVKAESAVDLPAQGLLHKAETWKADLIVMGSHGRSAIGRFLLGSVAQRVLNHAQAGVRIARARLARRRLAPRLLIAVDGSPASLAAVEAIARRAWPKGTQARLLAVVETPPALAEVLAVLKNKKKDRTGALAWLEHRLEGVASKLSTVGLEVVPEIQNGDPRHVILKESEEWQADCLFLGSRGHNAVERFLLGSLSSAVASHAPCTVEIVRPGAPNAGSKARSKRGT